MRLAFTHFNPNLFLTLKYPDVKSLSVLANEQQLQKGGVVNIVLLRMKDVSLGKPLHITLCPSTPVWTYLLWCVVCSRPVWVVPGVVCGVQQVCVGRAWVGVWCAAGLCGLYLVWCVQV